MTSETDLAKLAAGRKAYWLDEVFERVRPYWENLPRPIRGAEFSHVREHTNTWRRAMSDEKVKVEQCDREAAASYNAWLLHMPSDSAHICRIREGKCGDGLAEAFARHRWAALSTLRQPGEGELRECPFDAGKAVVHEAGGLDRDWHVFCETCDCQTPRLPTEAEAIAAMGEGE